MKVLLVEDEPELASALRTALTRHGVIVDHVTRLDEATEATRSYPYDVMILDRRLPDGEGLSLIPSLRAQGNSLPVLILTARGDLADKVEGLDYGADDYMAKPFAIEELLARIRALARRSTTVQNDLVTAGSLSYDFVHRDARINGQLLELTRREHLVLGILLRHFGRMVSRATLMDAVFGMDDEVQPNALDTQVSRLRRKLADSESGLIINGVRGVGYMLETAP